VPDADEPIGLWISQGLQKYALNNAEDDRVCPDADCQRYQRDGGEERRANEAPENLLQLIGEERHVRLLMLWKIC
jgi:hypothetical protein